MKYFLAIDIGASSGRHIIGWLGNGKLQTEEIYRFSNGTDVKNGHLIWDTKRLFREVVTGLKKARTVGKVPVYVGIDTWAVDYALLDGKDNLIGEMYAYRDSRTNEAVRAVHSKISFEELYGRTGVQFQPFNTVYQLYADKMSGKADKAETMLMLPDYLNFLLTGVKIQEYTNATSTGLINASSHGWDSEIISKLCLPEKIFNAISQPGTAVGGFTKEIQAETGYNATVILPATHDTASAVLAAPIDGCSPYISSGTWSLLGIEQPEAHTDNGSLKANYSNEGSINFGVRYQKNIMGLWLLQSVRKELGNPPFETLANMAESCPFAGLIDVNDNRFLAPDSMIEEIKKALNKDFDDASAVRTVYDSLAQSYADAVKEIEANTGKEYGTINIIGGGSRDGLLNKLTAKATGKRIITGPTEATAIGNIVMQMIGAGELNSLEEARNIIKKSFNINEVEI